VQVYVLPVLMFYFDHQYTVSNLINIQLSISFVVCNFVHQHAENERCFEVIWCVCVEEVWRNAVSNMFFVLLVGNS